MIPTLTECTTVGCFGPVASGKSYLLKSWLRPMPCVLVFDVTGEFASDPTLQHFWANPRALAAYLKENPFFFRAAYHVGGNIDEDFFWTFSAMWQLSTPRWFILDECHEVFPLSGLSSSANTLIRYARHRKCGILGASQRLADVSKLFTANSRNTVLFHSEEARDIIAVQDRWGDVAARAVENARPLLYDDASGRVLQTQECVVIQRGKAPLLVDMADSPIVLEDTNELVTCADAGDGGEYDETPDTKGLDDESPSATR